MGKALKALVLLVIVAGVVVAIIMSVRNQGDGASDGPATLQRSNGEVVVPRTEEKYGFTTDSVGG
jgi:hypothetical protein